MTSVTRVKQLQYCGAALMSPRGERSTDPAICRLKLRYRLGCNAADLCSCQADVRLWAAPLSGCDIRQAETELGVIQLTPANALALS